MATRVDRVEAAGSQWVTATRRLDPAIRSAVRKVQGYEERSAGQSKRPELPGSHLVVIIETGPALGVRGPGQSEVTRHRGGFVAGLGPGTTETIHDGLQRGIQIDLSPVQARRILGVPLSELAGQSVSLDDLLPVAERTLPEQIADAPDWEAKTAIAERWVLDRLDRGRRPDRRIVGALKMIVDSGGTIDIAAVQRATGLSRPHLVRLFRTHVGVTPKAFARFVRFDRIVDAVRSGTAESWAVLAADVGCYDQAHLVREVKTLAGMTPTALARLLGDTRLPGG